MQIALHQHGAGREIVYRDFLRNCVLRILPLYLVIFVLGTLIGRDKFAPRTFSTCSPRTSVWRPLRTP